MNTIKLQIKDSRTEPPPSFKFVMMFQNNVDERGVTYSRVGYYVNGSWFTKNDMPVNNVIYYSALSQQMDDNDFFKLVK